MKYNLENQLNYQHFQSFRAYVLSVGTISDSKLYAVWYKSPAKNIWKRPISEVNPWDNMQGGTLAYHCLHHMTVKETVIVLVAWYVRNGMERAADEYFDDLLAKVEHIRLKGKRRHYFSEREESKRNSDRNRLVKWRNKKRQEAGLKPRLKSNQVYEMLPMTRNSVGDDLNAWVDNEDRIGTVQGLMSKFNASRKSIECHLDRLQSAGMVRKLSDGIFFRQSDYVRWDRHLGWNVQRAT